MKFTPKKNLTWADIESWHPWFAWYPVRIQDEGTGYYRVVWLEWVQRRTRYLHNLGPGLNGPRPTEYCMMEQDRLPR